MTKNWEFKWPTTVVAYVSKIEFRKTECKYLMIPRPCQNLLCSLQLHKSWPRGVRSTLPLTATLQTQRYIWEGEPLKTQVSKKMMWSSLRLCSWVLTTVSCMKKCTEHVKNTHTAGNPWFLWKSSKMTPYKNCDRQNVPKAFLASFILCIQIKN